MFSLSACEKWHKPHGFLFQFNSTKLCKDQTSTVPDAGDRHGPTLRLAGEIDAQSRDSLSVQCFVSLGRVV